MKLFAGAYGGDDYKPKGNPERFYEWPTKPKKHVIRMDAIGIFAY